jgi:hypothetical protein
LHCQFGFNIVLNLKERRQRQQSSHKITPPSFSEIWEPFTFVTLVPARKNTINKENGKLHGCTACATAVNTAATIPAGVSELCLCARTTIAAVMGTHIMAFIV